MKPWPIGSRIGSMRYGTPAVVERLEAWGRGCRAGRPSSGTTTTRAPLPARSGTTSRFERLTLSTSSAPALDGGANLPRVERVDAHAHARAHELAHHVGELRERAAGRAADVDDVGAGGTERLGRGAQLAPRQPRGVVDLGQDLDVVVAVRHVWTPRGRNAPGSRAGPSAPSPPARRRACDATAGSPSHSPGNQHQIGAVRHRDSAARSTRWSSARPP